MMKLLMLKNTYEYIAVREPFSFSLNQITMCILSPVKDGVISQGNLAITPWTAVIERTEIIKENKVINRKAHVTVAR